MPLPILTQIQITLLQTAKRIVSQTLHGPFPPFTDFKAALSQKIQETQPILFEQVLKTIGQNGLKLILEKGIKEGFMLPFPNHQKIKVLQHSNNNQHMNQIPAVVQKRILKLVNEELRDTKSQYLKEISNKKRTWNKQHKITNFLHEKALIQQKIMGGPQNGQADHETIRIGDVLFGCTANHRRKDILVTGIKTVSENAKIRIAKIRYLKKKAFLTNLTGWKPEKRKALYYSYLII